MNSSPHPALTILTNTIPPKKRHALRSMRFLKRLILNKRPLLHRYEGHPAVTRSVLTGLEHIGASFNYNPNSVSNIAPTVLVLNDMEAFRQAIALKQQGVIQKLFGGPVLAIDPSSERELLSSPFIDGILVNSDWVRDFYIQEIPKLSGICTSWAVGVEVRTEIPNAQKPRHVLIYDKSDHNQPLADYRNFFTERGWDSSIIRYGSYTPERFLNLLQKSRIAVFFSPSESQGLALAESWALDVPTLVWNRGWAYLKDTNKKIPASSAPYLNPEVGALFSDLTSFREIFQSWEQNRFSFHPRQWVYSHLSDEICAKKLLDIMEL